MTYKNVTRLNGYFREKFGQVRNKPPSTGKSKKLLQALIVHVHFYINLLACIIYAFHSRHHFRSFSPYLYRMELKVETMRNKKSKK